MDRYYVWPDLDYRVPTEIEGIEFIPTRLGMSRAVIEFDNGYGVSIIRGWGAYKDAEHPFELGVIKNGELEFEPYGHLNALEVMQHIMEIKAL